MSRDRSRVLGALVTYLVLVIASAVAMDWFDVGLGIAKVAIGLRGVSVCQGGDMCVSMTFSAMKLHGMFPLMAMVAFWGSMGMVLFVTYQAGTRIIAGVANEQLSKLGYMGSLGMFVVAGAAGYLFGPDVGSSNELEQLGLTVEVSRTWAPSLLLLGHIVGIVTLRLAVAQDSVADYGDYKPLKVELPTARALVPANPATRATPSEPNAATDGVPQAAAERPATGPIPTLPDHLRKKLKYMTLTVEVTRAGIDARREDGSSLLVMWRDVVGVVARRLPPELAGATFVDVVSTAGATLRVMPWTRLAGDPVPGTEDGRARSLVSLVAARCPAIKLDPLTQEFIAGAEAAQLPDAALLDKHDARLA